MYQKNPTKKSKLHYVFIAFGILIVLSVVLFGLEKTGVTNFYTSATTPTAQEQSTLTGEVPSGGPSNAIDYSAPKPDDITTIADKNPTPATPTPTNPELAVVFTNARISSDLYLIKAVIAGTDSATCSATMSKGPLTATANSGSAMIEGQLSCKDLSIPMSQLPESGEWNLVLAVTDKTGATASTTEQVIL